MYFEGNKDDIREIANELLFAFNELVARRGENEFKYSDVMMGFHNAYKFIILELEKQCEMPIREYAVLTLRHSLPNKGG